MSAELARRDETIRDLFTHLDLKQAELDRIRGTLGWRVLSLFGPIKYRVVVPLLRLLRGTSKSRPATLSDADRRTLDNEQAVEERGKTAAYDGWTTRCERIRYDRAKATARLQKLQHAPPLSVLMRQGEASPDATRATVESLMRQYYPNWELWVTADSSTDSSSRDLVEEFAAGDARVKLHISREAVMPLAALDTALTLSTGELVGFIEPGDELTPDALLEVVSACDESAADLIYSDEDRRDERGTRRDPVLKPAWSPDLLLSFNYVGRFTAYRKSLLDEAAGIRAEVEGAWDYDLTLRAAEKARKIAHIPMVLYHRGPSSPPSPLDDSARRVLADALARRNIHGEVVLQRDGFRVARQITRPGKVTVIVPTRDRLYLLSKCIESIERNTGYGNYEIIIVDNGSSDPATLEYFEQTLHRVIHHDGPFNFSQLNNAAAARADGEYLVFLNNDTEVVSSEWLSAMVEQAQRPEVGAVGVKLLYPDGRIQHAGVVLGLEGPAGHSHRFLDEGHECGRAWSPNLIRDCSAVTAACMMVRRDLYLEMGGMNESDLPVSFNDVDLCLRLRKNGYLIVYTPFAVLRHREFGSRHPEVAPDELSYLVREWHSELACDPYYNPNLSLDTAEPIIDLSKPEALCRVYTHEQTYQTTEAISEGNPVGQEFFIVEDGLAAVAVRIARYEGSEDAKVRFRLRDSPEAMSDIASVEVPVEQLIENEYNAFCFDSIFASRGRRFYFLLELLDAEARSRLLVWTSYVTDEIVGPHLINHQPAEGTLSFRVYCLKRFRLAEPRTLPESRPGAPRSTAFGVNVAGYITGEFGLGEAARALVRGLDAAGVPFVLNSIEVPWHRNLDRTFEAFSDENPYRVNLIGANPDQADEFYRRKGARYFKDHYNVGTWFWELSRFPEEWITRFKPYQEIWVGSRFSAESLARVSHVPVVKITYPVDIDQERLQTDRPSLALDDKAFVFLFIFDFRSVLERKNPMGVINAFGKAFGGSKDSVLVLKSINSEFAPESYDRLRRLASGLNVTFVDGHWTGDRLHSLMAAADCYVSLHRSEGLGLSMAKSMFLGKAVIGTGYSGNLDFMNVNNSFLVRYRLVELDRDYPPYPAGAVWAEPDTDHAAELMRWVYDNREATTAVGARAADDVGRSMSPEAAGKVLRERLMRIWSGECVLGGDSNVD